MIARPIFKIQQRLLNPSPIYGSYHDSCECHFVNDFELRHESCDPFKSNWVTASSCVTFYVDKSMLQMRKFVLFVTALCGISFFTREFICA